jgi:hypothetical protein
MDVGESRLPPMFDAPCQPSAVPCGRLRSRRAVTALLLLALIAAALAAAGSRADARPRQPRARAQVAQQCGDPYSSRRDPSDPLALAGSPGADPLSGARFFVPGPAKGSAAGAIAQLLGLNPDTMPAGESWATFARRLRSGPLHRRLAGDRGLARKVAELSKIASQPEAQRISSYSWGGSPSGIFKQTEKILCDNLRADPGSIPIFSTYFLHASLGGCPTAQQVRDYMPLFRARVDAMTAALARRPAVLLLEVDGVGSTSCVARMGALREWEAALRYEIGAVQALPHAVAYIEAGYSDANSVGYTARVLNAIGVRRIRGFFTNDTHEQWTVNEARWATAIAKRTGGAHFIVNTADNGRGPLLNKHPRTEGVEDLCNPPGRGLGPGLSTDTGFAYGDAWMWTHPPGNSSGCGGGPPGGVFWPARAEGEAARANSRLGPGFPSRPY